MEQLLVGGMLLIHIQLYYYSKIPPFRQLEKQKALPAAVWPQAAGLGGLSDFCCALPSLDRRGGICYIYFKFEAYKLEGEPMAAQNRQDMGSRAGAPA